MSTATAYEARTTDPDTSHVAAQMPRRTPLIRAHIVDILSDGRPRTLDQIVTEYQRGIRSKNYTQASASSIRTRVAELRRDEQVERVQPERGGVRSEGKSNLGNPASLWRAVTVQRNGTGV